MNTLAQCIEHSVNYLASDAAFASLAVDPYWPKWDSPWWHMLLLHELGETSRIPEAAIRKIIDVINSHYLRHFPLVEAELPPGKDGYLHVPCHCALAGMFQVVAGYGCDPDREFPWVRAWFMTYQLPDGGLNCDERAYSASKKSSIISTLPPLEAVLFCTAREFSADELNFLDRGAKYLIEHRLVRAKSDGRILDQSWLDLCFPRFYEYDILRGMRFLAAWSARCKRPLPEQVLSEGMALINGRQSGAEICPTRFCDAGAKTRWLHDGQWNWTKATSFPLLEKASALNVPCAQLKADWNSVQNALDA